MTTDSNYKYYAFISYNAKDIDWVKVLSISIAAYNVEKFIEETLASLCNEEVINDLDIIVVNDGSKDKTTGKVMRYVEKYPESIRIINKDNGGYGSTINTSLPLAKGKYYKLLDGDDWYDTYNLERLVNILKKCETDLVVTPHVQVVNETREETIVTPFKNIEVGKEFSFENYPKGS